MNKLDPVRQRNYQPVVLQLIVATLVLAFLTTFWSSKSELQIQIANIAVNNGQVPGVTAGGPQQPTPECSPLPWLLTGKHKKLPYQGLDNDLDALLEQQAKPLDGDGSYKAVSLLFFNYHQSVMLQNCVYMLIKYTSTCNYIVVVWDKPSLKVCQDLNLPCFNAEPLVPGDPIESAKNSLIHSKDHNKITWMKPIVANQVLQRGYAVHATDIDIAYYPKNLMASYYKYITEARADAAFQMENVNRPPTYYVVNTGNYMVLPTEAGKSLVSRWVEDVDAALDRNDHDQQGLGMLYYLEDAFDVCTQPRECQGVLANRTLNYSKKNAATRALVRRTGNPWHSTYGNTCITRNPENIYPTNPCTFPHLYLHAVCVIRPSQKVKALKAAGFWMMDERKGCIEDKKGEEPRAIRCQPLALRKPEVEADFEKCDRRQLAFRYFQEHNGSALVP